jgi:two-component system, OmpR family, response regulator
MGGSTGADLETDLLSRAVTHAGRPIDLSPRDLRSLEYLMRRAGQVLLEKVWNSHVDLQTNVIDIHIGRLRQKFDRPGCCLRAR